MDISTDTVIPPLDIFVDFGDGSGTQIWIPELTPNVWQHRYTFPGTYTVTFRSKRP